MKTIVKTFMALIISVTFASAAQAASPYWVNDPVNCPQLDEIEFPGQSCSPFQPAICGVSTEGYAQCIDPALISPPGAAATSTTQYSPAYDGGFLLNCYADMDAAAPFCDTTGFQCNEDAICVGLNRDTECIANTYEGLGLGGSFTCQDCTGSSLSCIGPNERTTGALTDACTKNVGGAYTAGGAVNAVYGATCDTVLCATSDFLDCDGDTVSGATNGCEVEKNVTGTGSNVLYANTCSTWQCAAGWADCDGSGDGSDGACEVDMAAQCPDANSEFTGCGTCGCSAGFYDNNNDLGLAGDGCEIEDGTQCFVGPVEGVWSCNALNNPQCTCDTEPIPFYSGIDTIDYTFDPLLWGTQLGTGFIAKLANDDDSGIFTINNSGQVAIGTGEADASALLELSGTDGGFLTTRVTETERDNISSPATGLLVFNTTTNKFNFYDGVQWSEFGSGGTATVAGVEEIIMDPEFGAIFEEGTSGQHKGRMYAKEENEASVVYSFYEWITKKPSAQDIDLVAITSLPENAPVMDAAQIIVQYETEDADAANSKLEMTIFNEDDTQLPITGLALQPAVLTGTTWTENLYQFDPANLVGDKFKMRFRMFSRDENFSRLGRIKIKFYDL